MGGLNKSELIFLWQDIFGLKQVGTYKSEPENVDENIFKLGDGTSAIEIDIMQPIDPEKSPKVHIPPLNHIGLWVDDLVKAYDELDKKGVRFTPGGIRKGASGYDVCFIHPKGNKEKPIGGCGVLIELIQAPKQVVEVNKNE